MHDFQYQLSLFRFLSSVFLSLFASKQYIIKQLFDSLFVISQIMTVSVIKCYQPWAWLITLTSTLTDITKTSLFHSWGEWQNDEQEWQNMEYSNIRNVLKHGIYRIF